MTKMNISRPSSPAIADSSPPSKRQKKLSPLERLPSELLARAVLSLDAHDRNPLRLSQWRLVSSTFREAMEENVLWKDFSPEPTAKERMYRAKLGSTAREIMQTVASMEALDAGPEMRALWADLRATGLDMAESAAAPKQSFLDFVKRRSVVLPEQNQILKLIWNWGDWVGFQKPDETETKFLERQSQYRKLTSDFWKKTEAWGFEGDFDICVAWAHHGRFKDLHSDVMNSNFYRDAGLFYVLRNFETKSDILHGWPEKMWSRQNALFAMSNENSSRMVRSWVPEKFLKDKDFFKQLSLTAGGWLAIAEAPKDVVSDREKMKWWDHFVRTHPEEPINQGLVEVFSHAQGNSEKLFRLQHMYQVRPDILTDPRGGGNLLYELNLHTYNELMMFWPPHTQLPFGIERVVEAIMAEGVHVEERIKDVIRRDPSLYNEFSFPITIASSYAESLANLAISLASDNPSKYEIVLHFATENKRILDRREYKRRSDRGMFD